LYDTPIKNSTDLVTRMKTFAVKDPQPEVQIRGDGESDFEAVGRVMYAVQRAGIVKVAGDVVNGPNKHVAFMLQKDLLMPWRTIAQNIEFGLELRGVDAAQRHEVSAQLLAQCLDRSRRGIGAGDHHRWVARQHVHQQEGKHSHQQQHRDGLQEAKQDRAHREGVAPGYLMPTFQKRGK
jgi:hypothetical protein